MGRILWQAAYLAFLAAILVAPIAARRMILRRIRAGALGRLKGFGLYALAALAPTLGYAALFFALVGVEEVTGAALIAEEIGRSLLLVVGFGLLVWLVALAVFSVSAARVKIDPAL